MERFIASVFVTLVEVNSGAFGHTVFVGGLCCRVWSSVVFSGDLGVQHFKIDEFQLEHTESRLELVRYGAGKQDGEISLVVNRRKRR